MLEINEIIMNVKNLDKQQLMETKDVLKYELKNEKLLKSPNLIDFRLAFVIAIEAIDIELVRRQQYQLI